MTQDVDVVILVGGLGTRLKDVLPDIPKPMAEVCGKPFLEYILLKLSDSGFKRVILCVGYKAEIIKNYFKDKYQQLRIIYSEENSPLGTAGALKNASHLIATEPFILMNGDSFVKIDFNHLLAFHKKKDSFFTIVTTKVDNSERYGSVSVDKFSRIISFEEKKNTNSKLINAGIYVISRELLKEIKIDAPSLENDILPHLLEKNIYSYESAGPFIDIGTKESYLKIKDDINFLKNLFS